MDGEEWSALHLSAGNPLPTIKGADSIKTQRARTNATGAQASTLRQLQADTWLVHWNDFWGRLSYKYFNWRRDSGNDLLLFAGVNIGLLLGFGIVKVRLWRPLLACIVIGASSYLHCER